MRSGRRFTTAPAPAASRPPARWSPTSSTSRGSSPPTPNTACRTSLSSRTSLPTRRSCRSARSRPPVTCACACSTRGNAPPRRFTDILLEGLAPDGGLYVPEIYPRVDLASLRGKSYGELAHALLAQFMDDVPDLKGIVESTYTRKIFGTDDIAPLKTLEPGFHLLGLSNGPTLAFKDIAMQLLGNLFASILKKEYATLNILGATSGDTCSEAGPCS